jgi:Na+-transporting NADH:ubiquinone oxidoreductase subunit B
MSGDAVWVRTGTALGFGGGSVLDAFSGATPLGQIATASTSSEYH